MTLKTFLIGLSAVVCLLVVLKIVSYLDSVARSRNSSTLVHKCSVGSGRFTVLLMGGFSVDSCELLSETLFSIFQNAECPHAIRVTLVESVEALEKESSTLMLYKTKVAARGRFSLDFLDHITVHQVRSKACVMAEALQLCPRDRPMTLLADETNRFLPNWDTLVQNVSHRPAFCGAALLHDKPVAAYTVIDSFHDGVPQVGYKPLQKSGPPVTCIWASTPLLVDTPAISKMHGCSVGDSMLLYSLSGRPMWTTEEPIALKVPGGPTSRTTFSHSEFNQFGHVSNDAILGIRDLEAKPLEVIMKFGSLGNFKWAFNETFLNRT